MARPFLKWVGGKSKLLPELIRRLPADVRERRYFEPFLGGGALFFALAPERACLSDGNARLIDTYRSVRDFPDGVAAWVQSHGEQLADGGRDAYDTLRRLFNEGCWTGAPQAGAFICLNKTCFNGVFRENRGGAFNVPWGKRERVELPDRIMLRQAADALRHEVATLHAQPFERALDGVGEGDFVYLDPPYVPTSKSANFTSYTSRSFTIHDQLCLREACRDLDRRGALWMLSNSDTPQVRELYAGFELDRVEAPRSVSATGTGRGKVGELLIRNYAPEARFDAEVTERFRSAMQEVQPCASL